MDWKRCCAVSSWFCGEVVRGLRSKPRSHSKGIETWPCRPVRGDIEGTINMDAIGGMESKEIPRYLIYSE